MIFYGTRSSNIQNGQLKNIKCPNCENETSMTYSIFGKYAHVYWIPFFPIGKVTVTECNSCKKTFELKELPENIITKFQREQEKNSAKTPIWFFSGLIIIAIIAVAGYFLSQQTKAKELEFIDQPQVGDIYQYKTETSNYSTMKIDSVLKDSIYFFVNEMEITKRSGISEIDKDENYKELYGFSKSKIKEMYTNEEIYEINRD
jgi:hypothetical protein